MKVMILTLFLACMLYGQDGLLTTDKGRLVTHYEPRSITIGDYVVEYDSIVTMTKAEFENFVTLLRFFTAEIYFPKTITNKLAEKYLPIRFKEN